MRKTVLLALWLLTIQYSISYAGDIEKANAAPEFVKASLSNPIQNSKNGRDVNTVDDWGTSITIYSLIIGIYALYWFKQKA